MAVHDHYSLEERQGPAETCSTSIMRGISIALGNLYILNWTWIVTSMLNPHWEELSEARKIPNSHIPPVTIATAISGVAMVFIIQAPVSLPSSVPQGQYKQRLQKSLRAPYFLLS